MALCSLCQSIPFTSLPEAEQSTGVTYIADNRNLVQLWYPDKDAASKENPGFPWHEHLDALAKSTLTGCPLCGLVQAGVQKWIGHYRYEAENNKSFKEFDEKRTPIPEGQRLWLARRFGAGAGFVVLVGNGSSSKLVNLLAAVGFTVDKEHPLANVFPLRPRESDSGSAHSLNAVSSWVRNCIDNHERCREGDEVLPSRVLDVGSSGEVIRLVDTGDLSGKYASLSYCWGTSPDFITSKESLETRQSGIRLSDLPKTFSDAVTVTRHLSLRYLWIDSLCICQDDIDDWARESARMIDVYSKAHIVISANHTNDKSLGCFHQRELSQGTIISPRLADHEEPSNIQATLLFPNCEQPCFTGEFRTEPLANRGWALQERVLSRRNLHFGSDQLYFECNHGIVGEDGCSSDIRYSDIYTAHETLGLTSKSPITYLHDVEYRLWNRLLWAYGTRKLSRPTDKLPAVSGLASLFKDRFKAEYVAGLWSNVLIEGLAWQGLGDKTAMSSDEYIGPSWSWASYDGIAATGLKEGWKDAAEILEWHVDLKNEANPYGEVTNAWIRLRAPMAKLVASEKTETSHEVRLKNAGITPLPRLCTKYSDDEEGAIMSLDYNGDRSTAVWREWDLRVLMLGWYPKSEKGTDNARGHDEDLAYGLVVTVVKGEHADGERMKRVGWMFLAGDQVQKFKDDEESYTTVTLV